SARRGGSRRPGIGPARTRRVRRRSGGASVRRAPGRGRRRRRRGCLGPDGPRLMTIPRQLPNAITIARIPLAIVFFVLLLVAGPFGAGDPVMRWVAGALFVLAISTDWVDGHLARRHGLVSDFG